MKHVVKVERFLEYAEVRRAIFPRAYSVMDIHISHILIFCNTGILWKVYEVQPKFTAMESSIRMYSIFLFFEN